MKQVDFISKANYPWCIGLIIAAKLPLRKNSLTHKEQALSLNIFPMGKTTIKGPHLTSKCKTSPRHIVEPPVGSWMRSRDLSWLRQLPSNLNSNWRMPVGIHRKTVREAFIILIMKCNNLTAQGGCNPVSIGFTLARLLLWQNTKRGIAIREINMRKG